MTRIDYVMVIFSILIVLFSFTFYNIGRHFQTKASKRRQIIFIHKKTKEHETQLN